ncbi:MAG: nitroreductase [Pseudomonadales bacterium]|nr:nitroreductase [Pseudomonadales bacterium]
MNLSLRDAVLGRHSIRGFQSKSVPDALLKEVFELAQWSPSGTNQQPWQVYVASGETLERLRAEFVRRTKEKVPANPDYKGKGRLKDPWKARRRDCAKVLYDAMGIEWEDMDGRSQAAFRNFEMFDAPHVAFLGMDGSMSTSAAADVGMYAQTLMLSLSAHGLASCAQGTMGHYPDLVRETFAIDQDIKILFGISFGYEDKSHPANLARTVRATLAENVVFMA